MIYISTAKQNLIEVFHNYLLRLKLQNKNNLLIFCVLMLVVLFAHTPTLAQAPITFGTCGFDNTNGTSANITIAQPSYAGFYNTINPTEIIFGDNASMSSSGMNEFEISVGNIVNNTGADISHVLVTFKGFGYWSQSFGVPPLNFDYFIYDEVNQRWVGTLADSRTAYFYVLGVTIDGTPIPTSDIKLMPFKSAASGYTLATTSNILPSANFTDAGTSITHSINSATLSLSANLITADLGSIPASTNLEDVKFQMAFQIVGGSSQDAWVIFNDSPIPNPPGDYDFYVNTQLDLLYVAYDYGDAPSAYGMVRHSFDPCNGALYLGENRNDYELSVTGSSTANADDINASGYNDEDVEFPEYNIASSTYTATFPIINNLTTDAYVYAWIDWNDDGVFSAPEMANATVASSATTATLTWKKAGAATGEGQIPAVVSLTSDKIVRIRIGSVQSEVSNSTGTASDGEVEDLLLSITNFPLPITLVSFDAYKIDNSSKLTWVTASEENNKGFEIERSLDGKNWIEIGFVNSKSENDNKPFKLEYNFTDYTPANGQNFYRLKQVDYDRKFEYSPVRMVSFNKESNISIFPNPAVNHININGLNGNEKIMIYDIFGRMIMQKEDFLSTINIETLSPGTYSIVILNAEGIRIAYKFVKMK